MITPPIRLKRTMLTWLPASTTLPAFAQIPPSPGSVSSAPAQTTPAVSGIDVAQIKPAVDTVVNTKYRQLDPFYKDIRTHPEPTSQETRAAAKLVEQMHKIDFGMTEHVGKTGVVTAYRNGTDPTVLARAELDALPMEEKAGLPYANHIRTKWRGKDVGVARSYGHNLCMASWVGTAKMLVSLKDR